jgi:hypothetical protein
LFIDKPRCFGRPEFAATSSHIAIMILCLFHQIELSMNSCSSLLTFGNAQICSTLAGGRIGKKTRHREALKVEWNFIASGTQSMGRRRVQRESAV